MCHVLYGGSLETYKRVLYETLFLLYMYLSYYILSDSTFIRYQCFTSSFPLAHFLVISVDTGNRSYTFSQTKSQKYSSWLSACAFPTPFLIILTLYKMFIVHLIYPVSFPCLQSPNTRSYNLSSSWTSCVFLSSLSVTMIVKPSYSTILILPVCLIYLHTFMCLHMPVLLSAKCVFLHCLHNLPCIFLCYQVSVCMPP